MAAGYSASQHWPLRARSCARSAGIGGDPSGVAGTGCTRFASRLPLPLSVAFMLVPALRARPAAPSGAPSLRLYLKPNVPVAFQHGIVPHWPPAGITTRPIVAGGATVAS